MSQNVRSRAACSGRARRVLDYIDAQEQAARRPELALLLPLAPNAYATLRYAHPMDGVEWEQMMAVLAAMKPGIVE